MNKTLTLAIYRDRILAVVDYIWRNIERDVELNTLADVAHFSPYHFHRIYREMMHETVSTTVRRLRLHYAACQLLRTNHSVETIATTLGYGSGEAFSRAFSRAYSVTPSAYRQQRSPLPEASMALPSRRFYAMKHTVEIEKFNKVELGGLAHQGDYLDIGAVFEKVFVSAGSKQFLNEHSRSFGIYYDDPTSKDKSALRSHACVTLNPQQVKEAGLDYLTLEAGNHAVLTFTGPYSELEQAYEWFYGEWLPQSGYQLADRPPFEEYLNDPKTVPPSELLTKIYLPLAE
ncbi:AraC family transcriptional regulator [Saccharophagus degradans]|uniref:AraC family transcriptional regulator n=1 Tax=Saccharophagus degradans TaxID=86304 RepID=A0AAW7X5D3_9GAMM|nr:AraC family transcriptional regulator [Saccharophagus degradans]MDO6422619.1 AraC family transcriptional regulator [Saccharophagus degradans]MDO6609073.1 AraC family transcriptional regulator [Saccharophagus degradans]